MRLTTTITSKGQITLPIALRRKLRLKEGDRVDFQLESDGRATLIKHGNNENPFRKWAGRLGGQRQLQDAVQWQRDLRDEV
jgi:antitoxin PrlF